MREKYCSLAEKVRLISQTSQISQKKYWFVSDNMTPGFIPADRILCYGEPDLPEKEEGKWLSEIAGMQAASARDAGLSAITAPCLRLLDQESKTRSLFSSCNKGSLYKA